MLDIFAHHESPPPGDHSSIAVGGVDEVDSFDHARIDQLMIDRHIKAPQSWDNWSLSTRIAWLKLQLENAPGPLAPAKSASLFGEPSVIAKGKAKTKVSLMASLAALANPSEPKVIGCESHDETLFPAPAEWTPAANGTDPLRRVIGEIEDLDEAQALAAVGKLTSQSEASLFRLGGVLSRLKASGGWRKNHRSFKAFVEAEHEISYRTATRWIGVYDRLSASGVTGEQAQAIGWSKLKEIAGVVTRDNVNVWIAVAARNSVAKLAKIVASRKAGVRAAIEDKTAEATRMTVRLQAAQKETIQAAIEKAKAEAGVGAAAGALEQICANYVSGEMLKREAEAMGLEACLRAIEAAYPQVKLKVAFVEEAPGA